MRDTTKNRATYNPLVIERLHKKYGYTKNYIRQCLNGTRKVEIAEVLKKEYVLLDERVRLALDG